MKSTGFFPYCLLPIASCLLPLASCLLPTPYSLLPTPYSLLPTPYSLGRKYLTQFRTFIIINDL
ncbi:hypothetical protein [Moorena sp. SIO3I6]|uniref:hypothetical protein n=1 Tax=Moorena sp. SIO3I6 TaxID=2607831 RepID=UPI0013FA4040|nr:hypothetical protein [Moorena sp. SIO3I6]NEP22459.1 hypothetical protein [Moorena sp. SIO3I6]